MDTEYKGWHHHQKVWIKFRLPGHMKRLKQFCPTEEGQHGRRKTRQKEEQREKARRG